MFTVNLVSGTNTYAGSFGGSGTNENNVTVAKTGAGTLILTGSSTSTGGFTLTTGTLQAGNANALGTTGAISFGGGTLQYGVGNTTDYSSRFAMATKTTYNIDTNGQNVTFATPLSIDGTTSGIAKSGSGTLTLAAGSMSANFLTITGGVVATTGTIGGNVRLSGGVWQPTLTSDLVLSNTLGVQGAGNINYWNAGGFAAKGAKITLNMNGGADLIWATTTNFMGAGATYMIFGSPAADNQVELKNNINLNVGDTFCRTIIVDKGTGTDSALLSGALSSGTNPAGTGGLVKSGRGTLILTGQSTYIGNTVVSAGTLVAGNNVLVNGTNGLAGAFGYGTGLSGTNNPSAIALGNNPQNNGGINVGNGDNPTLLIGGAFEMARNVTVQDVGTNNVYAIGGSTDANALFSGTITTIAGTSATGTNSFKVTQVATTGSNALTISGAISAASAGTKTVNFDNVGAVVVSGSINNGTGVIALLKTSAGTLDLTGSNSYSGGTTIAAGIVAVNSGSSLGAATGGVTFSGNATLRTDAGIISSRNYAINNGATATIDNNGNTVALNGIISGSGSLASNGVGSLTLNGNNSYSGSTAVNNGSLIVGSATALGSGSGSLVVNAGTVDLNGNSVSVGALSGSAGATITTNFAASATLTTNGNSDSTFAGTIQNGAGTVGLAKSGSGTLTLSGNNTYTDTTSVNGGTVMLTGSIAGNVSVAAGGKLAGSGVVAAASTVYVQTGGTLAPGTATGTEALTVGTLILDNGSTLSVNLAGGTASNVNAATAILGLNPTDLIALHLNINSALTNDNATPYTILYAAGGVAQTGYFSYNGVQLNNGDTFNLLSGEQFQIAYGANDVQLTLLSVPEPSTVMSFVGGLGLLVVARRMRKQATR